MDGVDNSFERFLSAPDGKPLIPVGKAFRVFWFEQKDRLQAWRAARDHDSLARVFSLFGPAKNIDSLQLDLSAAAPFLGEWHAKMGLGRDVKVGREAIFLAHGGIDLGDHVTIGQRALLSSVGHPLHPSQRHLVMRGPVRIGRGALIGADAVILNSGKVDPVIVGEGAIILPGAIVTKNVPAHSVIGGLNQIYVQGPNYFQRDLPHAHAATLRERLTRVGLMKLGASVVCDRDTPIDVGPNQRLLNAQTVFHEQDAADKAARDAFFSSTPGDVLDICVLAAPLYAVGAAPKLHPRTLINSGCFFSTASAGQLDLGEKTLLAPLVTCSVAEWASILFDPGVWCGARAEIHATKGQRITIGAGSVIAAGAIVREDVAPLSIIVGRAGTLLRQITDDDMYDLPSFWTDPVPYRAYLVENIESARAMTPAARAVYIKNTLG